MTSAPRDDDLPWLVCLPHLLGDAVCSTPALRHLQAALAGERRLEAVAPAAYAALLRERCGPDVVWSYEGAEAAGVLERRFGAVLDFASNPLWPTLSPRLRGRYKLRWCDEACLELERHRDGVDERWPTPFAAPPADYAEIPWPAWLIDACMVSLALGDDVWSWLERGDVPRLRRLRQDRGGDDVVLLPAGTAAVKRWPTSSWCGLADALTATGRRVRVVLGPREREAWSGITLSAEVVAGLDVAAVAALLEEAALVVANDCGPMHMSAALDCPTVAVFGPTNPDIWFCYGGEHRRFLGPRHRPGDRIIRDDDPWDDWPTVSEVLGVAGEILSA